MFPHTRTFHHTHSLTRMHSYRHIQDQEALAREEQYEQMLAESDRKRAQMDAWEAAEEVTLLTSTSTAFKAVLSLPRKTICLCTLHSLLGAGAAPQLAISRNTPRARPYGRDPEASSSVGAPPFHGKVEPCVSDYQTIDFHFANYFICFF